ncbi:hypothetical protein RK21_05756 [Pseudomonas plecoglossicida]|uniref:DUF3077 domain-containing protein n=2 Tax=Pseudomonas TaxID=286 RepID=V7DBT6_9PSED|nr:hypothetical protein RK21_05756 [Pseudomonas plecoglossicida]ESW38980.1 hypothetical protein O164_14625 [Pseudomonas taiwanensis SJ9]
MGGIYLHGAELMNDETKTTPGVTYFYQGEGQTHPLFRIAEGIPCRSACEQASELMGYARDLSLTGLMDGDQQMMWASHYFAAMAKALLDDAELGLMR